MFSAKLLKTNGDCAINLGQDNATHACLVREGRIGSVVEDMALKRVLLENEKELGALVDVVVGVNVEDGRDKAAEEEPTGALI